MILYIHSVFVKYVCKYIHHFNVQCLSILIIVNMYIKVPCVRFFIDCLFSSLVLCHVRRPSLHDDLMLLSLAWVYIASSHILLQ